MARMGSGMGPAWSPSPSATMAGRPTFNGITPPHRCPQFTEIAGLVVLDVNRLDPLAGQCLGSQSLLRRGPQPRHLHACRGIHRTGAPIVVRYAALFLPKRATAQA